MSNHNAALLMRSHIAKALKHVSQRPQGTLRCIIVPGKAIYQTILPLCRTKVPMLRSTKNYWVLTCGEKRGRSPNRSAVCRDQSWSDPRALVDTAAVGLMKASHGAVAPATKHVYLCQSLLGQRLEEDREDFASHVFHSFDGYKIQLFSNIHPVYRFIFCMYIYFNTYLKC